MTERRTERRSPALRVRCDLCGAHTMHLCEKCSTPEVAVPVCKGCAHAHALLHDLSREVRQRLFWRLKTEFEPSKRLPQGSLWDTPASTEPLLDEETIKKLDEAPPLSKETVLEILAKTQERIKEQHKPFRSRRPLSRFRGR